MHGITADGYEHCSDACVLAPRLPEQRRMGRCRRAAVCNCCCKPSTLVADAPTLFTFVHVHVLKTQT
jgi:hypothetical protein